MGNSDFLVLSKSGQIIDMFLDRFEGRWRAVGGFGKSLGISKGDLGIRNLRASGGLRDFYLPAQTCPQASTPQHTSAFHTTLKSIALLS